MKAFLSHISEKSIPNPNFSKKTIRSPEIMPFGTAMFNQHQQYIIAD